MVTPRACAAPDGDPLPLHDHVRRLLARNVTGVVNVFGPRGCGKTTALRRLAAVLPPDGPYVLLDDDDDTAPIDRSASTRLVVLATRQRTHRPHLAAFAMAPWTCDDVIEYLLAARPDRCASVMQRIKEASDRISNGGVAGGDLIGGVPELCAAVLGQMIDSDAVATPAEALRQLLAARLGDERARRGVTAYCLRQTLNRNPDSDDDDLRGALPRSLARTDPQLARLVRYPAVQLLLGAQRIVWDLAAGKGRKWLHASLPAGLLSEVGSLVAFRKSAAFELHWILQDQRARRAHPIAASILHATGTGWRPEGLKPDLCGARLEGAKWAGIDLSGADLTAAHLAGSNLDAAKLDDATVASADLTGASLRGASLRSLRAMNATFAGANLSAAVAPSAEFLAADLRRADLAAADLHGARLVQSNLGGADLRKATLRAARIHAADLGGANLSGADLTGARLTGVSFRDTVLLGALFHEARLLECDLAGVCTPNAVFREAVLSKCDLADSSLPGADFRGAMLHSAGLADVRWEGADLRDVDFTGSGFHTGSSRSGLVGSTIASEGTRTGFYTDDYDDRAYKPPEEIRKATLCGSDLRGAKVDGTDFYLVDLRRARYTTLQAEHFRRCGAIL